ncbi:MAG: hypothetical protein KGI54_10685 [Pseudomonadota bacterium]|nr:hypothetical protein [Pseudomonadota bacterium]
MKTTTHNPSVPIEDQHYKKRFLVRKLQEREAELEIETQKALYRDANQTTQESGFYRDFGRSSKM